MKSVKRFKNDFKASKGKTHERKDRRNYEFKEIENKIKQCQEEVKTSFINKTF